MLNSLLSQLGASSKVTVGVAVTPTVGLEMIEINPKSKSVEKYACKALDYDYSKREIADYDRFREVLIELFEELQIEKKSNIVITLPSVHYGLISLPTILSDEAVTSAIISEVENSSYIFKRQDPCVSWVDAYPAGDKENREILYGAVQQAAIDEINAACVEIGCNLLAIDSAPNALLKALSFTDLAEEQMAPNTIWSLMVINQNSYAVLTMNGKSVTEYREEPLALRSFVGDEIYEAIISSSQLALHSVPSNYLYIVSETDMVSAEVLSMKIPFDGNIKFLECNKYVQNPMIQASYEILPNMVLKISPDAIGAGIYVFSDFPFKFNLLGKELDPAALASDDYPKITIGNVEYELSSSFLKKMAVVASIVIAVLMLLILYLLNTLSAGQQKILNDINSQMEANKTELAQFEDIDKKDTFDVKLETNAVQAINRTKLIYYSAISTNLPARTWLIYLYIYGNKKIDIIGRTTTVDNVYSFYKGLKLSVIDSNLRLNRMEMSADSVGNLVIQDLNRMKPTFYEFEITNKDDNELSEAEERLNSVEDEGKEDSGTPSKRRRGFLFEDFLQLNSDKKGEDEASGGAPKNQGQSGEPPKSLPANLDSIENF